MTTETTGAPEGVTEDTSLAESEALIHGQEAAPEAEAPADDAGAPEAEQPAPKPRKSAQERIDELTAARREAEREAEFWRTKATQAPQPNTPAQAAPPQEEGRPDPNAYATDDDYLEALSEWKASQIVDRRLAQREAETQQRSAADNFRQRLATSFPDGPPPGLAAYGRYDTVPAGAQEVILASEHGPKIAAFLGDNPHEYQRLMGLSVAMQAVEATKIEARFAQPAQPRKTATDAPPATPQVRGAGGQFKPAPDTGDFEAFQKAYGGS